MFISFVYLYILFFDCDFYIVVYNGIEKCVYEDFVKKWDIGCGYCCG